MLATARCATLIGLDAHPVRVEVEASRGVPSFELVGLAEMAVRESRVRVKSALYQLGVDLCECRIVVNLAPADLRKVGSGFDVAIAAATLAALRVVPDGALGETLFLGELSLTGAVQPLRGVLAQLVGARKRGVATAVVPRANEAEAALVEGIDVRSVATLAELVDALRGKSGLPRVHASVPVDEAVPREDLADVRGQPAARRALEIAAAGGHNLLMIGTPGAGKTMLARRMPSILPPLAHAEALEVMSIHSVAGLLAQTRAVSLLRPFRAPHHTVSEFALVGGGEGPRPGEVSLAHHGVLFLDELAEFRRPALEALRQPLEDGAVTISRARLKATFPARPLLVAAMNPCPCGYLGDPSGRCACSTDRVRAYRSRLSGPLLDRIDVHVVLPPVDVTALQSSAHGEASDVVRARVVRARARQAERVGEGEVHGGTNAVLSGRELDRVARPCARGSALLRGAVESLGLSARAYTKVLRLARTIADLDGSDAVSSHHIAEAVSLRVLDRGGASPPARGHVDAGRTISRIVATSDAGVTGLAR
jgi:magnesium chelatase family protein